MFAALAGLAWFSTVPLTVALTSEMYGVRHMGTLVGLTFTSHQVGGALSSYLAGRLFDLSGSYTVISHGHRALTRRQPRQLRDSGTALLTEVRCGAGVIDTLNACKVFQAFSADAMGGTRLKTCHNYSTIIPVAHATLRSV